MANPDDFYVGYVPEAPPEIASHVKRWILIVIALALLVGAGLAIAQGPFAASFFDFGQTRTYEGVVSLSPHPLLHVARPGQTSGSPDSTYYLVGFGKHGAESDVSEFEGQKVRLEATPIYRDDQTMLEVVAGTVEALGESRAGGEHTVTRSASLGQMTLTGEIVDSKCHLGVMKPGHGKPHRACATLCIRGGAPPLFVVRQKGVPVEHLLLVGSDGRALNQEVLPWVAETIRITGEVVKQDDLWLLRAEPKTFKPIS